MEKYLGPKS